MSATTPVIEVDPFDLPEWLGTDDVVWQADHGLRTGHVVPGRFGADGRDDLAFDLIAVDEAAPAPVTDDESRVAVHRSWGHGQVLIGRYDDRLAAAVPGTRFDAERVIDTLSRVVRAVGGSPEHMSVLIRVGAG